MLANIEMKLFELEFDSNPNTVIEITQDDIHYRYTFEYQFGKWRIVTI